MKVRIAVIASASGNGKTTLARELASYPVVTRRSKDEGEAFLESM